MTQHYPKDAEICENQKNKSGNLSDVDFEEALDHTGFGKYNLMLILVCGFTIFGVNNEAYSIGYILPSAECDLNLDTARKGIISSVNFIGLTGSCCIWGYVADTKGRKAVLTTSLIFTVLSSVISAFTPSFWGFAALRLLNGIFLAGPSAVVYAYFGEFQGKSVRSKATAWTSSFVAVALVFLPCLGWLLLPQKFQWPIFGLNFNSWRMYMLIMNVSNIAVAIAFAKLPESPKYLYYKGNVRESLNVMKKIYSVNTGRSEKDFPVKSLQQKIPSNNSTNKSIISGLFNQIIPLFMRPHVKYILSACLMQAGVFASSSGLLLWYPDIIKQLSTVNKNNSTMTVCQTISLSILNQNKEVEKCQQNLDDQIFIQNIIIGAFYCVAYAMWAFLVNLLGNRNFFGLCMIISSITLLLLNFVIQKIVIDLLFIISLTLPGIGVAVIMLSVIDVIPTYLCGVAVCLVMSAGRLGSLISSFIIGLMLEWDCTVTFLLFSASLIVCLLLMLVFPKKGHII